MRFVNYSITSHLEDERFLDKDERLEVMDKRYLYKDERFSDLKDIRDLKGIEKRFIRN